MLKSLSLTYANGGITSGSLFEGIYPPLLGDEGRPHLGGDEHTAYGVDEMTDIVADLGYTDHSHLNKELRYFAGMTPTQYMHHLLEIKESNFIKGYFAYHTE